MGAQYQIFTGDAIERLRSIDDNYFRCCITSPPYWGLRDYGIPHQIGAEKAVYDYINNLVDVFREVKRVLTIDGTLWINIGDSYTSGNRKWRDVDKKNPARGMDYRPPTPEGLKPKDLIGVPWRLAFALQNDGWYLRSDIIWFKPNCQPESVKDRPTRAHEYLFLLSREKKYHYNYLSILDKTEKNENNRYRNKRTVWVINTESNPWNHFAMFPESLVEPCILAGSDEEDSVLDPFCGSGTVGVVALKLRRRFIGIDLNPEYTTLAMKRIRETPRYGRLSDY
jgi:DNA modification methylase